MKVIVSESLGQAWLEACDLVLRSGEQIADGETLLREIRHLTLDVNHPSSDDSTIGAYGSSEHLDWMMRNFFELRNVPELGNAASYGVRLRDYERSGLDQIQFVIDKLRRKPESKSATITTLMPLSDRSYIPCVSLLDFWIRDGRLELVVYARSLDLGKKAYGNLLALAKIQEEVAEGTRRRVGHVILHVKSAHIYVDEEEALQAVIAGVAR